ncbi:hypothetical protein JAO76_08550 [Pontibacter sp. BT310]|uniref:Thymidylate kinase-like domain-containing protein n=1 Tax=Pontibacter populi TaxID=890055 RepID=A0ABS6XDA8_9BACT|nr:MULTISPECIES: hypothetical protein [Pontibacter]MBJ6118238.1 hypothetical protein [Pontibacter sp. BT310]MBR0570665.1 hypothetical protein [Microvirga sp. STS03]MBW3365091.1 hypothetical protein [Pontibacter populi]
MEKLTADIGLLEQPELTVKTAGLLALIEKLHLAGIKYFLLTDFESDFNSRDVDLFVDPDYKEQFEQLLLLTGWYKRKEPAYHTDHHFYYSPHSALYLDVKYALSFVRTNNTCYTYSFLDEAVNKATLNSKGLYRPTGIVAITLYAAHLAFKERGKLEEKHRHYLTQYMQLYQSETEQSDQDMLNNIANWHTSHFPENTNKLQQIILPNFRLQQKKMVRPKSYLKSGYGLKVLFLGTDGAGKSTLLNAVGEKIHFKTSKLYLGMGENGWTSKYTKLLYNFKSKIKWLNRILSMTKSLILLPLEFLFRIIPVKLRSKYSVVLIDRFPGSFLLEDGTIRSKLYKAILPKPDLVFFLYADPEILVKRKPSEITLERSKADIQKFRKVAEKVSGGQYISIDTSELSITEATDLILNKIYRHPKVYKNLLTDTLTSISS